MKVNAFLFEGMVTEDILEIIECYADCVIDFAKSEDEVIFDFDVIQKGVFEGYINEGNWYVGTFTTLDGRVFNVETDARVTEITIGQAS